MAGKWNPDDGSVDKENIWASTAAEKPDNQGGCGGKVDSSNLHSTGSSDAPQKYHFDARKIKEMNNIEFMAPLADEFKCPLCLSLMNEPQLTTCGHHFCKSCIEPLLKRQPGSECPVCNENRFDSMTDKAFERKIKALKVFCPEREDGCEWTGELVSLEHHLENQCGFVRVNCVFDVFGCEAKVLRMKMDVHIQDMISHMNLVLKQFKAQQQSFDQVLQDKDDKIRQLEEHIDKFETNIEQKLSEKSDIKWMPLDPTHHLHLACAGNPRGVKRCPVPDNVVPGNAKELLILIAVHSGGSTPLPSQCITVFVEGDGVRYAKYIKVTPHSQDAWNDNTDNVWLPMPNDRLVYVDVPVEFGKNFWCDVVLRGYR